MSWRTCGTASGGTSREAKIGKRQLKDLRDTFASQLLTAGVQLGYVSLALGHADVAVTARHYARWAGGDLYRPPMQLEEGEVPADLLARLHRDSPLSIEASMPEDATLYRGPEGQGDAPVQTVCRSLFASAAPAPSGSASPMSGIVLAGI